MECQQSIYNVAMRQQPSLYRLRPWVGCKHNPAHEINKDFKCGLAKHACVCVFVCMRVHMYMYLYLFTHFTGLRWRLIIMRKSQTSLRLDVCRKWFGALQETSWL